MHAPTSKIVFHAEGVTKTYQMGEVQVHALRGADLDLYESEFVVLLGPSGSGKSTLLNILGVTNIDTHLLKTVTNIDTHLLKTGKAVTAITTVVLLDQIVTGLTG